MKSIFRYFACICLLQVNQRVGATGMPINGDPFLYIRSAIPYISNYDEFFNIINQDEYYVIIISYQNNHFGINLYTFMMMAKRYDMIYRQFANNKKIKIYRTHMTNNIHPLLYGHKTPSCQIYYKGEKIATLEGVITKQALSSFLQKNLFRSEMGDIFADAYIDQANPDLDENNHNEEKYPEENDDEENLIKF